MGGRLKAFLIGLIGVPLYFLGVLLVVLLTPPLFLARLVFESARVAWGNSGRCLDALADMLTDMPRGR